MDINSAQDLKKIKISTNLSGKNRSILEVALLLIFIGLFTWFLVLPKKAELDKKAEELSQLQDTAQSLASNFQKLKTLVSDLSNHEQSFIKLDDALPLEGKAARFQMLLEKLAQDAGVTIGSINVTGGDKGVVAGNVDLDKNPYGVARKLQKISAGINVVGSFDQIYSFWRKVETNGRIMSINSIEVSGYQNNLIQIHMGVEGYYFGPSQ